MKAFSVARTFSAGVELIERKPWTLVWWAVAIIFLQFAPRYLLPQLLGGTESVAASAPIGQFSHTAPADPATIIQQFQQSAAASHQSLGEFLGWMLWACFYSAILYNAAFRAVLEPQKSAFGYLRLGAAEFWQFLVLATVLGLVFAYAIAVILLSLLMLWVAGSLAAPWSAWLMVAYIVALVLFTYWIMLRLSLGSVMTFAERRYRLFHSWGATKSSVWRLFWTGALSFALVIGLYVLFFATLFIFFIPVGAVWAGVAQLAPGLAAMQPTNGAVSAEVVLWLVAVALIFAVIRAITLAPWAAAYRELYADRT
jgi:hypothetical protein